MDDTLLLKIALTCSIVGIVALFFAAQAIKAEELTVSQANFAKDDAQVSVTGKVAGIKNINSTNGNFAVLSIEETQEIPVFLQNRESNRLDNNIIGKKVFITGKIQDYNGKKEIIGEKIEIKQ